MHKRPFQAQQRTFMHASGLLPPYFDLKKTKLYSIWFFNQNMLGEDLRLA